MSIWGSIGTAVGAYFGGPAGASIGGSIGSNLDNANAAQSAQTFSAEQFATRYQTTTRDMMAAGLNPMLAYNQGGGAPPTGVSYQNQNPGADYAQNVATAAQADNIKADTINKMAQADNIAADTELKRSQADNQNWQAALALAQTQLTHANRENVVGQTGLQQFQAALMKAQASGASAQAAVAESTKAGIDLENEGFKKAFNNVYKTSPALALSGVLIDQGKGVSSAIGSLLPLRGSTSTTNASGHGEGGGWSSSSTTTRK